MGLVGRNMAVLLGGAAVTICLGAHAGWAQEAEPVTEQPIVVDGNAAAAAGEPMEVPPVNASSVTLLDLITVVSRVGDSAIDQMASVSVVGGEALERRQATTSQDIFFGLPGITAQGDSKRVATSINIRGLQDFGRVAVIVDGSRQDFHKSAHGTQNFFVLDPELIQQVEVIRGPVANTYGSGAIGGVVVFETKDAGDFLKPEETWALSSTLRYETNGEGWTTSTTGAYRFNDAIDVIGNLVYRDYQDYEDGNGDVVGGTAFDALSGLLKATIRPTENSELKLGWIGADDSWTDSDDALSSDMKQNTWTAQYALQDDEQSWLDLHVNLSYNKANLDQTYLVDSTQFDAVTGLPVVVPAGSMTKYDLGTTSFDIWNTSRFDTAALSHELTYGGDWVQDKVVNTSGAGGPEVYTPDGQRVVSGAYIQDKITWEWLEVLGALRYDYYKLDSDVGEASGDRLSPRITVGVTPFQDKGIWGGLQLYGTYAEGYRSPSITETLISGLHPQGVTFPFLPNPLLEPETAETWEAGLNFKADDLWQPGDTLRVKAAYFNNNIDNYIGLNSNVAVGEDGCPYYGNLPPVWVPGGYYIPVCAQYQNYAEGKIDGFEFEGMYDAQWMFGGLTVSISDGHTINDAGITESMITVPPYQATGTLGFRLMENKLVVGGEVQYNASATYNVLNSDGDMTSYSVDDYTLVNLFATYQASENFRVDFRVDNLLNETYENALNAASLTDFYGPGITAKIGATVRFGG